MTDKQPMQAMADGKGDHDDGIENAPGKRAGGSESSGGAYPNPHTGKSGKNSGFMGHGGQTDIAYHGTGQGGHDHDDAVGNPNAPTE